MELTANKVTVRGTRDDIEWFVDRYGHMLMQDCRWSASDKGDSMTSFGIPRTDLGSGTQYPGETGSPCTFAAEPEPRMVKKSKSSDDEFYVKD